MRQLVFELEGGGVLRCYVDSDVDLDLVLERRIVSAQVETKEVDDDAWDDVVGDVGSFPESVRFGEDG